MMRKDDAVGARMEGAGAAPTGQREALAPIAALSGALGATKKRLPAGSRVSPHRTSADRVTMVASRNGISAAVVGTRIQSLRRFRRRKRWGGSRRQGFQPRIGGREDI
jgi:nucleotide-binding universal stress UspA family protein